MPTPNNEVFDKLLQNCPDALFIADGQHFLDANPSALKMFGVLTKNAFVNMHPAAFSPEYQADGESSFIKANKMITLALANGSHRFEWLHQTINGREFFTEVTLSIFDEGDKRLTLAQVRDISSEKKEREFLGREKERYVLAIEGSNEGIWDWNVKTNELYLSVKWKASLGYEDDELKNSFETFTGVTHPDDLKIVMSLVEEHFKTQNEGIDLALRMQHKNGNYIFLHVRAKALFRNGEAYRMVGFISDINEIVKNKRHLSLLKESFENVNEAIFIIDPKTRKIIESNNIASKQTGYTKEEIIQMSIFDLKDEKFNQEAWNKVLKELRLTKSYKMKTQHIRKDKSSFPVEIHAALVSFDDEEYIVSTVRDLSIEDKYFYENIYKQGIDPVFVVKDGIFIDANEATLKLLEFKDISQLKNLSPLSISPEFQSDGMRSKDKEDKLLKKLFEEGTQRFDWTHINSKGKTFDVDVVLSTVQTEDGVIIMARWRDITKIKQEKEALFAVKQRYELAIDGSNEGLWDWNIETGELFLAPKWKKMLGYEDNELLNEFDTFEKNIHPEDFKKLMPLVQEHLEGKSEGIDLVMRMRHKDGYYKWVHDKGKALFNEEGNAYRMVGFHSDINEIVKQKDRLALFEKAYHNTNDAIFIIKADTADIIDANIVATRQLGYTQEELCLMKIWQIKEVEFNLSTWHKSVDEMNNNASYLKKINHKRKDNSIFPVGVHADYIKIDDDVFIISTVRDLTIEQAREDDLTEQKNLAKAANMAKSTFLANMSHEIRTPMNAILGFTDMMQRDSLSTSQRSYLETIHSSASSLLEIINDILDLSKIESGKFEIQNENFDLSLLLNSLHTIFKLKLEEKGLYLKIDCALNISIKSDEVRFKQILLNVISNAIKFTEAGGISINVSISQGLRIEIKDTGMGVADALKEHIFVSFEQQPNQSFKSFGGTGLGLSICKQLCTLMGGDVWVEDYEQAGSNFILDFKNIRLEIMEIKHEVKIHETIELPECLVLIVDDIMTNRLLIEAYFEDTKVSTIQAVNGKEAIEMVEKNNPDLVLMDINMPIMDGKEATKILKSNPSITAPIVALTADIVNKDKNDMLKLGFDLCLSKPISRDELFSSIASLLKP